MTLPLSAALILAVLGAATPAPEPLRVGIDVRSMPWGYVPGHVAAGEDLRRDPVVSREELARIEGLDVDVLHALEKQLGARFELVPTSWFRLEQGLLDKSYNFMIGSWTPSLHTPEAICASPAYCRWGLLLVARANDPIRSPLDLEGRRVGHYRDAAVAEGLRALGIGLRSSMVGFDDGMTLFEALQAGQVDAAVYDSTFVRWYMARHAGLRVLGEPLNQLGYHLGARRDDPALCARIAAAIEALRASGELERIQRRWEGGGPRKER